MAAFAITAHNFPEGLATFFRHAGKSRRRNAAGARDCDTQYSRRYFHCRARLFRHPQPQKTVLACLASGLAEPLGAVLGYTMLKPFLSPFVFGAVFGVIAGVMVFLALDELLPAAKRYSDGHETVYGLTSGMAVIALSLVLFHF